MYKGPFKWWVQSVMPLVFDDSLSYYEVLAKLTKYIEGLTGDVQEIEKVLETIEGIEDVTQFTEFLETIQAEIGDLANLSTQSKTNLVSAINEIALKADIAYYKPPTGIPESDLSQGVQDKLNKTGDVTKYIINNRELKAAPSNNSPADLGLGTYSVPSGGIPWDTLSQDVQDRINAGGSGTGGTTDYTDLNNKPQINGHTLNAGNNTAESLGLGTYSKPSTGIPESDLSAEVQEKLNTSGGIADSETSFVATRDYEAGELIYINGVLYKTKYKILSGTNLIPGNNIEATDISNEIEKINNDIEALQSGSGPDSWTLGTNIQNVSSGSTVRFFEYFNCIGNESYLFIITPVHPFNNGAYYVYIKKRDGSQADRQRFDAGGNETQHRFTFVPTDTGEYYCEFESLSDSSICDYRIEIEYTESQGISELWSQVNKANQLEPRVGALETLIGEQQTQLDELTDVPEKVETLENDTNDLKNTLYYEKQGTSDNFINAFVNTSGSFVQSVRTIANCRHYNYIYDHLKYIKCPTGYSFAVYGYSKTFNYLGALMQDDTFSTVGNAIRVTEFDLQKYPDILIRIGLSHFESGSATNIAISDANVLTFVYDRVSALTGKSISVIGDSISTFTGYTNPNAPSAYYPNSTARMYAVGQMYWMALAERNNMVLDVIDSYGGSTIGVTWDTDHNYTPFTDESRLSRLGNPNVIIVEGGINDFGGNPLGEYPSLDYTNMYEFRTSYAYLLNQLRIRYTSAKIVCLSMLTPKTYNNAQYPEKQTQVKQALSDDQTPHYLYEFNASIKELCARYGCIFCDIYDITNYYINTSSSLGPHPAAEAHLMIANRIEAALENILS